MAHRVSAARTLRYAALAILAAGTLGACKASQPPGSAGGAGAISVTTAPAPSDVPTVHITVTATPTPTPTVRIPVTLHPTATPHPTLTLGPTATRRPALGDLTIHLARGDYCGFYSDTSGGLWLNPRLVAGWTGPGPFPAANLGFAMTTNYGKHTAGGPVTSTAPFTWAIGGEPAVGNSWLGLGRIVKITVTIDPGNDVHETNESNNVTVITVPVPSPLPFSPSGSDGDYTIPCS